MRYFEIEFGEERQLNDREYVQTPHREYICIKADHYPSEDEIKDFCKEDMRTLNVDTICDIIELTKESAEYEYDFPDNCPILRNGKKIFQIPVSWKMYGYVYIEASDIEEACSRAEEDDTPFPEDGEYVGASWRVDWKTAYELNLE